MLKAGDPAPDFPVGEGSLHEILREREAVVFFFPKAFTPTWSREAGGFRRDYERFRAAGAEVIGVSGDAQETQDRFARSLELPFPLVGDAAGAVRAGYGVNWPILGLARRVTFVIGKDRRVKGVHRAERDAESHVAEACALVSATAAR